MIDSCLPMNGTSGRVEKCLRAPVVRLSPATYTDSPSSCGSYEIESL